ncbi:MAG: hypothetical protein JNJ54_20760 [Myxococcaceae bacterium]|nr:hypothetical protein [Myxococcaceae bacterium]
MRALLKVVALSSFTAVTAAAQAPVCNTERASLLFDLGPGQKPRLLKCDGQQWSPYELSDAVVDAGVPGVVQKSPEELAQCKASCATQNTYCLKTQCGPIAGAPCKQRCAKTLAICTTGCTPKAPEPVRVVAPSPAAAPMNAPPLPERATPAPPPAPPPPGPSPLETFGKALDVVDRGLDVVSGTNQPAPAASPSSGVSASATCCVNGAGYTCPSPAAADRCSGAFMRCLMGGKSGSTCMKEAPPDPSGCRRDPAVSCK